MLVSLFFKFTLIFSGGRGLIVTLEEIKQRKIKKCLLLIEEDKLMACEDVLSDLITMFGETDESVRTINAYLLIKRKMLKQAKEIIYQLFSEGKSSVVTLYLMGRIYKEIGNPDMTYFYYKRAIRLQSINQDSFYFIHQMQEWVNSYYSHPKNVLVLLQSFKEYDFEQLYSILKSIDNFKGVQWNPILIMIEDEFNSNQVQYDEKSLAIEIIKIKKPYELTWEVYEKTLNLYFSLLDEGKKKEIQERINLFANDYSKIISHLISIEDKMFWCGQVLTDLTRYIDFDDIHLIYSTNSSNVNHMVAIDLKQKYHISWIMEDNFLATIKQNDSEEESEDTSQILTMIHTNFIQKADFILFSRDEDIEILKNFIDSHHLATKVLKNKTLADSR